MKSLRPKTDMFLTQVLDLMPLGMKNPLPTLLLFRFLPKTERNAFKWPSVQCFFCGFIFMAKQGQSRVILS